MRIVYITNSYVSVYANDVQTIKMCEAIANLGHELILFTPTVEKEDIQPKEGDAFSFYDIGRVFGIKVTPFRRKSVHAFISAIYIGLLFLLVPEYSYIGAAWAFLGASAINSLFSLWIVRNSLDGK